MRNKISIKNIIILDITIYVVYYYFIHYYIHLDIILYKNV